MSTYSAPNYIPTLPDYQSTEPVDLITKVGMIKQGEYDTNQQNLQDQIAKLGQYPIIKESDRAIIADKMKSLVDNLNKFSGQDLGDSRVYNKLLGITSEVYNDPQVFEKIADNMRAVRARRERAKMIEDDPSTYGANNDYVFNKAMNQWLEDPNAKFNASYMPYQDDSEWKTKIIDDLYKNPDTFIKTLPDGSKVPYATEELKQVLPEKIKAALAASMPSNIRQQYQIDWQAQTDGATVDNAFDELNDHISDLTAKRNDIKNQLAKVKDTKLRQQGVDAITGIDEQLKNIDDLKAQIRYKNDPHLYYSFEKHLNDKFNHIGNAFQMKQEGKLEWNPFALAEYKNKLDMQLEAYKAKLKQKEAEASTPVSLIETLDNLAYTGQAFADPGQMSHLLGEGAKPDADGTFPVVIHNRPVLLDLQPILAANGDAGVDVKKSVGVGDLVNKFATYQSGGMPFGIPASWSAPTQTQVDTPQAGGAWSSSVSNVAMPGAGAGNVTGVTRTFKQFIADQIHDHPEIVPYYKTNFGLDVTNSKDLDIVNKIASNPKEVEAITSLTRQLQNFGGSYRVHRADGAVNLIPGSATGQPLGNVIIDMDENTMRKHVTDANNIFSNPNYNHFLQTGMIKNTNRLYDPKDAKSPKLMQVSVWIPTNPDIVNTVSTYATEYATKKDGIDVAGEQRELVKGKSHEWNAVAPFISHPDQAVAVVKNTLFNGNPDAGIAPIIINPVIKNKMDTVLTNTTIALKNNIPKDKKKIIISHLIQLKNAKSEDEVLKILSQ